MECWQPTYRSKCGSSGFSARVAWTINKVPVPLLCLICRCEMPGVDFEVIRTSIAMAQVLDWLGFVPVRRSGSQLRGACPVHQSDLRKRTSFSVNLATNRYRCFPCGSFGNQLELWAAVHNKSVYEAALDLCARAQMNIPWIERRSIT